MRWLHVVRKVWIYVVVERFGYRRASPITDHDSALRRQAEFRIRELERDLVELSTTKELYSRRLRRHS